jgi:hypothetical protein
LLQTDASAQVAAPLVRKKKLATPVARALARVSYDADRGLTPSRPPNGPFTAPHLTWGTPGLILDRILRFYIFSQDSFFVFRGTQAALLRQHVARGMEQKYGKVLCRCVAYGLSLAKFKSVYHVFWGNNGLLVDVYMNCIFKSILK